ncbi:MAG: VOC family protein [Saprospiraceae bacterium]|nr:VOC family protein [Saprospiraceae bacterium]
MQTKQIFINLAVRDVQKSSDFYQALGFSINPQFSDENGMCMVWSDKIFVMLLNHEKFKSFTNKPISDSKSHISGIFSLSVSGTEELNNLMSKGLEGGGIEPNEMRDYGFMQQRTIEDPDGYTWELFYMDLSKFPEK